MRIKITHHFFINKVDIPEETVCGDVYTGNPEN